MTLTARNVKPRSAVHALNLWTKLVVLLLVMPAAIFLCKSIWLITISLGFLALVIVSKESWSRFWRVSRIYYISIPIAAMALSLLLVHGNVEVRALSGVVLAVRFLLLISFGILFALVTNPVELPLGFLQLRLPHRYGVVMMVAMRMLPLISKKIRSIVEAQEARGVSFKLSVRRIPQLIKRFTSLMVPIVYATLEISVQLSDTLVARGYNPKARLQRPVFRWTGWDAIIICASLAILLASILKVGPS